MKPTLIVSLLLASLSAFSQNRQQLLMRADILVADSNYGKAITIFNQLLTTDSADFEVYEKRGLLYQDMHDYPQALPFAENNDMKLLILINRAETQRSLHHKEDAVADLKLAYSVDSTNLGVLADLGAALGEEHPQEALFYLGRAIAIDSSFEGGLGNMAFLYSRLKNYKKAVELSNKLLRLKPNEPFALNNRGFAKMQLGDLEGALEDINNSILLLPYNSYAFRNRGELYLKMGKKTESCDDFYKAISLGFTKDYGDEVEGLIKQNCGKKPEPGKM